MATEEVRKFLSNARKKGHKENPMSKDHYKKMQKASVLKRKLNRNNTQKQVSGKVKLSTRDVLQDDID